jgi:DNA replication factor GINS
MNLDELRSVRRTERQKDSLQHLRDSFYEDAAQYIESKKAERKQVAASASDPFSSPEVSRLTDEIETAEEVVEAIYERRVGKVVKLASFAAADMPTDKDGLTAEERRLFEDLVSRIQGNRRRVLDMLAGEGGGDDAGPSSAGATDDPASSPSEAGGEGRDRVAASENASDEERPVPPEDVLSDAMGGASRDDVPTESARPGAETGGPDQTTAGRDAGPSADSDAGATADAGSRGDDAGASTRSDQGAEATRAEFSRDDETVGDSPPAGRSDGGQVERQDTDRVTLRITEEVGAIFGVDEREYDLAREDVVTLPAANAEPLLERDAAERLE